MSLPSRELPSQPAQPHDSMTPHVAQKPSGLKKILYILSSPHGGSTLMSHLLGRHTWATNLGEAIFIPKLIALDEPCTCTHSMTQCEHWQSLFTDLEARTGVHLGKDPYGFYMGDAIKQKMGSGKIDHEFQTPWRKLTAKLRGGYDTALLLGAPTAGLLRTFRLPQVRKGIVNTHLFYELAATHSQTPVIVDASKTLKKGPHLYQQYPEQVRILHLSRDGRAVSASRTKYMPVANAAERWNHYHSLSKRMLERWVPPEHRRFLRYEDFVAEPDKHLRDLFTWLDMPFEPDVLDFTATLPEAHSAGGNPARFGFADGIKAADERWRTTLSEDDLNVFEQQAGTLNRAFGYE